MQESEFDESPGLSSNCKYNLFETLEYENMHFKKNPFMDQYSLHMKVSQKQIPKIIKLDDDIDIQETKCFSISPIRKIIKNNFSSNTRCDSNSSSLEKGQFSSTGVNRNKNKIMSSFDEEILAIKSEMEVKEKVQGKIKDEFRVIKELSKSENEESFENEIWVNKVHNKVKNKILVLELDKTLIYVSKKELPEKSDELFVLGNKHRDEFTLRFIYVRPGAIKLLEELSGLYQIIIYTSLPKVFAETLIKRRLDPDNIYIDGIIDRQYCLNNNGYFIKDLRILKNCDLSNVVFLGTSMISLYKQLDNGIFINSYKGAKEDPELFQIIKLLKSLASVNSIKAELRKHFSYSDLYKSYLKEQTSL